MAAAALLCASMIGALFWTQREALATTLHWLRLHSVFSAALAVIGTALLIARRRAMKRTEFARSWLAAVPIPPSTARWEALFIEIVPALAALGVLVLVGGLAALALALKRGTELAGALEVLAYLSGGITLGVIGSYLIPQPKPVDLPPGSRYVPHPRLKRPSAVRPALTALGQWPIRQVFAWTQPKIVARAILPILIMMPLGTTADDAMVVIAMFGVSGALLLLWSAVISVSRLARRWLAPLPVRPGAAIRAFLLPPCGVIVAAGAVETSLLLVFNVSYRISAEIGACTVLVGCVTIGAGLLWSARPERRS
jgi:hypothetical protein